MDREEYIEVRDNTHGIVKLMTAVEDGEVGRIKELIESGIDIEARNKDDQTALMVAAQHGQPECIETLVKLGANIEAEKSVAFGGTALTIAAKHGQPECIETLVKLGASIEAENIIFGGTALTVAAEHGQPECIKKLVELGANIKAKNGKGQTTLMIAARYGRVECIEILVKLGADVDSKRYNGWTALMYAAWNGRVACIEKLVKLGSNIKAMNNRGRTALMYAAKNGKVECIEILVKLGADIEARDKDGKTALMIAAKCRKTKVLQLLLIKGADIAVKDNDNKTAIAYVTCREYFYGQLIDIDFGYDYEDDLIDFGYGYEDDLIELMEFIKWIYENYMNLNEAIINQIEMDLDHGWGENHIVKVDMFLFQINKSLDLSTEFYNKPNAFALLMTGRELFIEARNYRIQRIIGFWKKWYRKAYKSLCLINRRKGHEKKVALPAEIIDIVCSFLLPRYLGGNIIFSKDILDASGDVIGAEECSVMVTNYHCQESANEMEKLLRQEEKAEKKNIL